MSHKCKSAKPQHIPQIEAYLLKIGAQDFSVKAHRVYWKYHHVKMRIGIRLVAGANAYQDAFAEIRRKIRNEGFSVRA